jgi:hypothetical protein
MAVEEAKLTATANEKTNLFIVRPFFSACLRTTLAPDRTQTDPSSWRAGAAGIGSNFFITLLRGQDETYSKC